MPQAEKLISHLYLKLGGTNASGEIYRNLISIEVDDSLLLPDTFSIHLHDPKFDWVNGTEFELGKKVEISAPVQGGTAKLLAGEITAIETHFSHGVGPTLTIRGYDQSHRLHRVRQTKPYLQKTDSDIAKDIARDCGLKAQVDDSGKVHEYVLQDNQTDYEFLRERARRIGFRWFVKEDTLYFKKALGTADRIPVLEWGMNLLDFEARMTTARQVTEVIVRGWDPKNKKEIIGRATTPRDPAGVGGTRTGGQAAKKAFNIESKEIVTNRPVATQAEADALAQSKCDEIGNAFIQAEGICGGNPAVSAGAEVELKGVGQPFSRRWRITHSLHRYEKLEYTTHFTISPIPHVLGELLAPRADGKHSVVIGIVTNNRDPDGLGRVKVRFPELPGNEESHWARLVTPMAGAGRGIEFVPEVQDEVLVAFEHDDVNHPFVLGALWNGKDAPPVKSGDVLSATGKVEKRLIRSRSGHTITLDDTDGACKISIVDKSNNTIEIDSEKNTITINTKDSIALKAQGSITLKAQKDIELEAKGKVKIKGSGGASLEGSPGKVDIKGTTVNLN